MTLARRKQPLINDVNLEDLDHRSASRATRLTAAGISVTIAASRLAAIAGGAVLGVGGLGGIALAADDHAGKVDMGWDSGPMPDGFDVPSGQFWADSWNDASPTAKDKKPVSRGGGIGTTAQPNNNAAHVNNGSGGGGGQVADATATTNGSIQTNRSPSVGSETAPSNTNGAGAQGNNGTVSLSTQAAGAGVAAATGTTGTTAAVVVSGSGGALGFVPNNGIVQFNLFIPNQRPTPEQAQAIAEHVGGGLGAHDVLGLTHDEVAGVLGAAGMGEAVGGVFVVPAFLPQTGDVLPIAGQAALGFGALLAGAGALMRRMRR